MRALSRDGSAYLLYNIATAVVAILIMAPAAFFAGMTLPIFTLALLRAGGGEASVGRVYAANTIGAIAGVFLAMHVLIPGTGLKLAMIVAAVGDIALGLVLMRRAPATARSQPHYLGALVASAAAIALVLAFARFDPSVLTAGVYRTGVAHIAVPHESVVYYKDGKTASIGVVANRSNGTLRIVTNGKPDALLAAREDGVQSPDEATMILAAALPLALHKDPRDVANIGFGSGLTVHTLLGDSRLRNVDTIEIEPAMYEGAKAFGKRVERAYTDPRAHIHFEDAKAYFASHASKYDIIISEPSNPWVSGVAGLFTREWYRFVPRHLNKGGLLVQWIQLYEINEELVASIVNALSESFQDYRVFLSNDSDLIIVARADGDVGELDERVFAEAGLRQSLRRIDITNLATLRQHAIGNRRTVAPLMAALSKRANSDFHPFLTLEAPKARFSGHSARAIQMLPIADLPILEGIGGLDSVGPSSQIGWTLYYLRTQRIADAAVIAAALAGRATDKPVPVDASPYIALLRAYGADCAGQDSPAALDAIHRLAARTIPFLDPDELRGAWIEPAWLRCRIGDAGVAAMLDVASALSRRDGHATLEAATQLLVEAKGQLPDPVTDYLSRAAMLGAVMSKDFGDVAKIDDRFGGKGPPSDSSLIERVYLRAMADAASTDARMADDRKPQDR
jgi:hypothetical protein